MRLAHFVRRRQLTGAAGEFTLRVDPGAGGEVTLSSPDVTATFNVCGELDLGGRRIHVAQSDDPAPRLTPLEEGPDRLGIRVEFRLWEGERAVGEGLNEVWLTSQGEAYLAWCLRVATLEPVTIRRAALEVATSAEAKLVDGASVAFGDAVLSWPLGRGRRSETLMWSATRPPFYERWPPLFDQWSLDPATFGWDRFPSGGPGVRGDSFELAWVREPTHAVQFDFRGIALLALGERTCGLQSVRAHEHPLELEVVGGRTRGYEELDGTYPVALDDDVCRIVAPPDPLERTLRLRLDGLAPGERAEAQGVDALLHVSERRRTDDPLVPLHSEPVWPADGVVASVRTRAADATTVVVERRRALTLAYQRRDPARRLTIHHPADPGRPICSVDLSTVHLRDVRLPGAPAPAVLALPLYWTRYLPKAGIHHANELQSVEVTDDDGDRIGLRLTTTAPGGGVSSVYSVAVPFRDDGCVEVNLAAQLVGADAWGLPTFEFGDLFPQDSIDPLLWDYETIVFVDEAGTRVSSAPNPYPSLGDRIRVPAHVLEAIVAAHAEPDCGPWTPSGAGAVVLHGSPRGTIIAVAGVAPESGLEPVLTLCEHWVDIHFDAAPAGGGPVASELGGGEVSGLPATVEASLRMLVVPAAQLDLDAAVAEARTLLKEAAPVLQR